MGESFPSPDGIPSRQSRLGPFLWFVQNRWEKFWGIIGGGGGVWQLVCSQGEAWLVKYWAVHKGCKQTLPAFNYNKLLIGFGSAVLIGVKTNWSPIIACPGLATSSRDQSINKASLVAIMVIAVALVDVSGGRTTWWRTSRRHRAAHVESQIVPLFPQSLTIRVVGSVLNDARRRYEKCIVLGQ